MCYLHAESVPIYDWTARLLRRELESVDLSLKKVPIGSCAFWQRSIIESQLPEQFIRHIHFTPSPVCSFFFSVKRKRPIFLRTHSYFRRFREFAFDAVTSSSKRNRPHIRRKSRNQERKHSVYTYNPPTLGRKNLRRSILPPLSLL